MRERAAAGRGCVAPRRCIRFMSKKTLAVTLLISVMNGDYLAELLTNLGRTILVGGVLLWNTGVVWLRALMKVTY